MKNSLLDAVSCSHSRSSIICLPCTYCFEFTNDCFLLLPFIHGIIMLQNFSSDSTELNSLCTCSHLLSFQIIIYMFNVHLLFCLDCTMYIDLSCFILLLIFTIVRWCWSFLITMLIGTAVCNVCSIILVVHSVISLSLLQVLWAKHGWAWRYWIVPLSVWYAY